MADPLSFKSSGLPHRTSRDRARAHGAKVQPKPQANGYCGACGAPHDGPCAAGGGHDAAANEVSAQGGGAQLPRPPVPFKLGG